MDNQIIQAIRSRIERLNQCRDAYYNRNESLITDWQYDDMFDELKNLEDQYHIYYGDSPTQSVGFEAKSFLKKVKHNPRLLSLDKTKDAADIVKFVDVAPAIAMLKYDGLTVEIDYRNGQLVQASTRGDGAEGEDITHNVKVFKNVPVQIPILGTYRIVGEAIIHWDDFETINSQLPETERFKTPRNLVSGTVRQLDNQICSERSVYFMPWDVIEGNQTSSRIEELRQIQQYGFTVPDMYDLQNINDAEHFNEVVGEIKSSAQEQNIPIDGVVVKYNDFGYARSCGSTAHHNKDGLAFKFMDDQYRTVVRKFEWGMGRTGALTPVVVFDPVIIDGTTVQRATLCNVSMMRKLKIGIEDVIEVRKANMIIPQVMKDITADEEERDYYTPEVPATCPCCGQPTAIRSDGMAEVLVCTNPLCRGRLAQQLVHFTGKSGMDIAGFGLVRCQAIVDNGVVQSLSDVYHLADFERLLLTYCNMSKKQMLNLIDEVNDSRKTTLNKFLSALSIPGIGLTVATTIAEECHYSIEEFMLHVEKRQPFDIGNAYNNSLWEWFNAVENVNLFHDIARELTLQKPETERAPYKVRLALFAGKTVCLTGSFAGFTRVQLQDILRNAGAIVKSDVGPRTDYLLAGEGGGVKRLKALDYHVSIVSAEELYRMMELVECVK